MSVTTPTVSEFKPLPQQLEVIKDIRTKYKYNHLHEVLLSGSVGSAKTLALAHLVVSHCIIYENAFVGVGRLTMPSLKETLLDVILKHMLGEVEFQYNMVRGQILFANGSKIQTFSWADKNYQKFRSYEFTAFAIEELTETNTDEFYTEIYSRVGRTKHVKEKWIVSATNPGDPEGWIYKRFIDSNKPTRHVYYSRTHDNPFLADSYIADLEENLDPRMCRRLLYGEWLSINQENVYYSYEKDKNFINESYRVNANYPIRISFDFNIGAGKPLSLIFAQYIDKVFHVFNEVIIEGARTENALEDAAARGLLDFSTNYIINGDATGKSRSTNSNHSDYEVIRNFLDNYKQERGSYINYRMDVPLSNPRVRDRHILVNGLLHNAKGERRIFVYKDAPTVDEGLRLTKLKPGANYVEDDSKYYQHCTTALGYMCSAAVKNENKKPIGTMRR